MSDPRSAGGGGSGPASAGARAATITGPLNWERAGKSGPPIVFVHPNPTDMDVWIYQMAHFSTWCRAIAIDLPGYGRSPHALPGVTMGEIAAACWEAVDNVSDEPAILAGCSVGFTLALHMASQQPDRTSAIILSGCSYRPEGKPFTENRIARVNQASGRAYSCR